MKLKGREIALFCKFQLWVSPCDLQMCAMCVGFPNCPKGQKRVGKTNFFLSDSFLITCLISCFNIFNLCSTVSLFFSLAGKCLYHRKT